MKFVVKVTGGRRDITMLSPGGGSAFVEAYLSKYMGFKCTVIDFPAVVEKFREYYSWAGFDAVGANIDSYVRESVKTFDVVLSLENIEHIHAAPAEYIAKFTGSLAQGGYFIISTPNMGSIAHIARLIMMRPTLPVPEKTFDLDSYVHYREYMPCEIIEAYEKNSLTCKARAYTNESPAFRKYALSRPAGYYFRNPVVKFIFSWIIQPSMSMFGIIPRFRYDMLIAAQKI